MKLRYYDQLIIEDLPGGNGASRVLARHVLPELGPLFAASPQMHKALSDYVDATTDDEAQEHEDQLREDDTCPMHERGECLICPARETLAAAGTPREEPFTPVILTEEERRTVLAALSYWKRHVHPTTTKTVEEAEIFGDLAPLDPDEIDALCDRIR